MKRKHTIPMITPETGTPEQLRAMEAHVARGLKMTNMKRTMVNNVNLFEVVSDLYCVVNDELNGRIPRRALVFFLYAISNGNGCMVCGTWFKRMLIDMGIEDPDNFQFTEEEEDLVNFAEALTSDPNHIPDDVYEALQARYDDETMTILVANAVYTYASNMFNNIVGVPLDDNLKDLYDGRFDEE